MHGQQNIKKKMIYTDLLVLNMKGQAMYVQRNARSCNHCFRRKAISITCCECLFVALGT